MASITSTPDAEPAFRYTYRIFKISSSGPSTGTAIWVPKYQLRIEEDGSVSQQVEQPWRTLDQQAQLYHGMECIDPKVQPIFLSPDLIQSAVIQLTTKIKAEQEMEQIKLRLLVQQNETFTQLINGGFVPDPIG